MKIDFNAYLAKLPEWLFLAFVARFGWGLGSLAIATLKWPL